MKKLASLFLSLIILFGVGFSTISFADDYDTLEEYYEDEMKKPEYEVIKARVIEVKLDDTKEIRDIPVESDIRYQELRIKITSPGKYNGKTYTVRNTIVMMNPYKLIFKKGDGMVLKLTEDEQGNLLGMTIYEKMREMPLLLITMLFVLILVLVGGIKGVKSVITLLFTGIMIVFVMLPLILKGINPMLVSIGVCTITATVTLVVISGINKKTYTAILGTVGGVVIAGILALIIGEYSSITGLGGEEAQMLAYIPQKSGIDYKGLLFSGIIIGSLGAIMDVTLSVASAMNEIELIKPDIKVKDLMKSGMNIGKDIMGSMSNTLILAYVGGSLHLMLLFLAFNMEFTEVINLESIASEVIRAMAGSIGLICAIPLTTFIGATIGREKKITKKGR